MDKMNLDLAKNVAFNFVNGTLVMFIAGKQYFFGQDLLRLS
jgi:hypothetical protein